MKPVGRTLPRISGPSIALVFTLMVGLTFGRVAGAGPIAGAGGIAGAGRVAGAGGLYSTCPLPPAVEAELIKPAFKDSIHAGPLIHPEVNSLDGLTSQILDMFMPVAIFKTAYDDLNTVGHSYQCVDTLGCDFTALRLTYEIRDCQYTAHAYFREGLDEPGKYAALIIPGSGHNQSTAIYLKDPTNYQYYIADIVQRYWDMYVYVKPNEDLLAIHRGRAKLDDEYIVSYLANLGGSYSCRYIVDTLAIVKYLKDVYDKVVVIGLSQGGQAALYNSLQSRPNGAVIASGFSVLQERIVRANLGQILIPGMKEYLGNEHIFRGIESSSTKYLFSWGRQEKGTYRTEAQIGCTRDFFAPLENVTCVIHDLGHTFPRFEVAKFLDSFIGSNSGSSAVTALSQNVPNPFVSSTRIGFSVQKESHVRLRVFDARGRLVSVLVDDVRGADRYVVEWSGGDDNGRPVPPGTYFYRLELPGWTAVKKMTLAR